MEKLQLIKNYLLIGAFISITIFAILYLSAIYIGKKQDLIREKQNEIIIKQIKESLK